MNYVVAADAKDFLPTLADESVDLFLIDPPFYGISRDLWDNDWDNPSIYAAWLVDLCEIARRKVKPDGSLIVFQPIGKHNEHPVFEIVVGIERTWHFQNWITWKKARSFGKTCNYPFGREEILWFSASGKPKKLTFNEPFTDQRHKRPGKTEFKRVSNVWDDIELVFRPERSCRRPMPLISRLVRTHSNPGDLVVDFFSGYGTTGIVAHYLKRRFLGCEQIEKDAEEANRRVAEALVVAKASS